MKSKPLILKKGEPVPAELINLALNWKVPDRAIPGGIMAAILEDSLLAARKASRKK